MRSNSARVLMGIAAVAVAVILLVVLRDDGESGESGSGNVAAGTEPVGNAKGKGKGKPAATAIPTIVVKGGEPVGGIRTLTYEEGDRIRFKVDSDVSDEVHVHGYDIEKEVEAGGSVTFDFPATIEGGFETEMHHGGQIAELIVNP
jgi:hypothetical protein